MRFGLAFGMVHSPESGLTWRDSARDTLEAVSEGEALGYSVFDCVEHHFQFNGWNPSPLVTLGAIAARTREARIGTNMLLLPLYHPVKLAEDLAALDNLSDGRLTIGVAPGYVSEEFAGMGVGYDDRVARFEETIDLLQTAWTNETFSFNGRFYSVPETRLMPRPVQQPHPPMRYGVSGPRMLRRAARRGMAVVGSPRHTVAELADQMAVYDEAAAEFGQPPVDRPVMRGVYIAETTEQAETLAAPAITHFVRELYGRKSAEGERKLVSDTGEVISDATRVGYESFKERYIIGNPDVAYEKVRELQESLGATEVTCWMHLPGLTSDVVMRSVRLFAKEVMPAFAGAGVLPGS